MRGVRGSSIFCSTVWHHPFLSGKKTCNRKAGAAFAPVCSETKGDEDPNGTANLFVSSAGTWASQNYTGALTAWLLPVNGDSKKHKDWQTGASQGQELSQMCSPSSAVLVNRDFWSWLALLSHSGKQAVITHCFLPKPILVPQITLLFSRVCDHMLLFAKHSSTNNNDCIQLSLIGLVSSWLFLRLPCSEWITG